MADVKISQLPETTSANGTDVLPIVDTAGPATKKIKVENLPVSTATQTALDAKADSADVYTKTEIDQKIRRVKKSITVQLDTPSPNPVIAPGASHTYIINLGEAFEQAVLTDFQWVAPSLNTQTPDTVIGTASLQRSIYGGMLLVNKTPGGWVRNFEINSSEFQSGNPTDVDGAFGANADEVDVPLGYGSSSLQVPLDHTAIETSPPKKLQVEDAYLSGTNLHITIKNYDSVSIDLSPYVGLTALFDENRRARLGSVSESGVLAYMGLDDTTLRLSEDFGETFTTVHIPTNSPTDPDTASRRTAAMTLTNNGANTFLALFNYQYIMTAESPNYEFTKKYNVKQSLPMFSISQYGGVYGGDLFRALGKHIDWKKTNTDSCMIFSGFLNYYSYVLFKSVDDGANFGANAPDYNNNNFIFTAGQMPYGTPNNAVSDYASSGSDKYQKLEPKVIDENVHYVSLSYESTPETVNNGFPTTSIYAGEQSLSGIEGMIVQTRSRELTFKMPLVINSALGTMRVSGSLSGNDGDHQSLTYFLPSVSIYYRGAGTYGAESVTLEPSEVAILKTEWDASGALPGDFINGESFTDGRVLFVRDATIDSVEYKIVKLGRLYSTPPIEYFNYSSESNGGNPIPGAYLVGRVVYRTFTHLGEQWSIYPTYTDTFTPESYIDNPNLKAVFRMTTGLQKSIVMKTEDGGATWSSICDHDELRYAPAHAFWSSNDGQTLMLAVMKYWNQPSYEKWPYPTNPSNFGSDMRFNISEDGGATWRNNSGSWDLLGINGLNPFGGQRQIGQLLGRIDNEILAVTLSDTGAPVLRRSTDNGLTFSSPIPLKQNGSAGQNPYSVLHNDSKEQFMGFFGNLYQSPQGDQVMLYYGSVVNKYTQWKVMGVK